ncbi:MAG TPA: hypothetical protein VK536_05230 [Candidatus Limnocylindrales bacterium]|nr:hypothetical protein [Candidatus Limnocylindrales bacterium]
MSPKWFAPKLSSIPPKARLELSTKQVRYSLGEQVTGQIKIAAGEEFDIRQLTVHLRCIENIKKTRVVGTQYRTWQTEYWDGGCIFSSSCRIFQYVRMPVGFSGAYEYSLDVSPGAKETLYGIDHKVNWQLFGLIEAKDRPNIQTQLYEIQVTRPQASQLGQTVMKEVTKEVVLIPCGYCGGLMPQTSVFCPNCGARRKS